MDIGGGPLMVDQSNWINESLYRANITNKTEYF